MSVWDYIIDKAKNYSYWRSDDWEIHPFTVTRIQDSVELTWHIEKDWGLAPVETGFLSTIILQDFIQRNPKKFPNGKKVDVYALIQMGNAAVWKAVSNHPVDLMVTRTALLRGNK